MRLSDLSVPELLTKHCTLYNETNYYIRKDSKKKMGEGRENINVRHDKIIYSFVICLPLVLSWIDRDDSISLSSSKKLLQK